MITHKYDDIIEVQYPFKDIEKIRTMTIEERAKIFAPFAALKGHSEAIAAKQKIVASKVELSEESAQQMDYSLMDIDNQLKSGKHPIIKLIYFKQDLRLKDKGEYIELSGVVAKLNKELRWIQIVNKKINLDDICMLEIEIC
jgi:hypothetical protein